MADNEGTGIEIAYSNASIHFNTVAGNAGSGITATNLLEQVSVDLGGGPVILAQNLRHNPAGGLSACTYGNGVTLAITPDVRNRPEDWVVSIGMDDLVNNQYTYDAFGNITGIGGTGFEYDDLHRLTDVTGLNGRDFGYAYDAVGNMLSVTKTSPAESYGFTYTNNRVVGVTYDADGNMTDDGVTDYYWDSMGRLVDVDGQVSYGYDALGKRTFRDDGGAVTSYAYAGEQVLWCYDAVMAVSDESVYLGASLLALIRTTGVGTSISYAHCDHLGSPVAFTDDLGTVIWPEQTAGLPYEIHHYEPFGADFDDLGTPLLSEHYSRYTGKLLDETTGKQYFNARYLNTVTDVASSVLPPRFLSPDVVRGSVDTPQGWNRYGYCRGNPISEMDFDGNRTYYFSGLGGSNMSDVLADSLDIRDTYYNFGNSIGKICSV